MGCVSQKSKGTITNISFSQQKIPKLDSKSVIVYNTDLNKLQEIPVLKPVVCNSLYSKRRCVSSQQGTLSNMC